ncbi:MAG TPA: hypothetical protein VNJ08_11000 [Bacteriovoracaceae bacterium]|nr:hypothetical protein [Bacteriovoracaceae bacterium]
MFKFFFLFASIVSTTSTYAQVPTKAITFDTDIQIFNASTTNRAKLETAQELIKDVVGTEEFRDLVLNHTYNGVKTFVDNGGLTNQQIYDKFLDGAESLNKIANNMMDMEIETYYENSNTVGYTNSSSPRVYMNTKYLDTYSAAGATSNMTHEWLHKLGFHHAVYYSTSRDYSVPYAVGRMVSSIAYKIANGTLTILKPATNVTLSSTSTSVTLNWSAASSSAGIKEYKVYRTLSGSTTTYLQGTVTGTTFTQTAPSSNATYYVKAVDNDLKTINSSEVSYVKPVLTAPANVTLTKTTTQVTLKWSAASLAVSYKIYRKLDNSSSIYLQGTTTSLSFTQSRPSRNAIYYVRSVDKDGNTMKSAEVNFYK